MNESPLQSRPISGWILPDGRWIETKEWWHISALYDLKDEQYAPLQSTKAQQIFQEGDEESIRNFASELGFIKVSQTIIDGEIMTKIQLDTLKNLLLIFNPDFEISVYTSKSGFIKKISVKRIFQLKNSTLFFKKQD
jgi:hypothetical protein